jgi:hypothetical protein
VDPGKPDPETVIGNHIIGLVDKVFLQNILLKIMAVGLAMSNQLYVVEILENASLPFSFAEFHFDGGKIAIFWFSPEISPGPDPYVHPDGIIRFLIDQLGVLI